MHQGKIIVLVFMHTVVVIQVLLKLHMRGPVQSQSYPFPNLIHLPSMVASLHRCVVVQTASPSNHKLFSLTLIATLYWFCLSFIFTHAGYMFQHRATLSVQYLDFYHLLFTPLRGIENFKAFGQRQ